MQCYQCEEHTASLNSRSRCTACQSATDAYNYRYYREQLWVHIRGTEDSHLALMQIARWTEITGWLFENLETDKYEAAVVSRVAQAATEYVANGGSLMK